MNKTDFINGLFELAAAYFSWCNAFMLWKQKEIKGVYWPAWVFFTVWGFWNLFYYPNLDQWCSFLGGIFLVLGNVAWCLLALKYRKKEKEK